MELRQLFTHYFTLRVLSMYSLRSASLNLILPCLPMPGRCKNNSPAAREPTQFGRALQQLGVTYIADRGYASYVGVPEVGLYQSPSRNGRSTFPFGCHTRQDGES
jgi:hypothetical protein